MSAEMPESEVIECCKSEAAIIGVHFMLEQDRVAIESPKRTLRHEIDRPLSMRAFQLMVEQLKLDALEAA